MVRQGAVVLVGELRRNSKRQSRVIGLRQVNGFSSIGTDTIESIAIRYEHDHALLRPFPRLSPKDFDEAIWLPMLNHSLAEKVKAIHVYANGYKLAEFPQSEFYIDAMSGQASVPVAFTADELQDRWVRLRPRRSSSFEISFSSHTPRRLFDSPKTAHSLPRPAR